MVTKTFANAESSNYLERMRRKMLVICSNGRKVKVSKIYNTF